MTDPVFVGSAHVLEGRVYPLSVFVSNPSTPWAPEDKHRLIGHERRAEAWIMTQAARYRVPLAFLEGGCFGFDEDVYLDHIPSWEVGQEGYRHWAEHIVRRIGWPSGRHLVQHLRAQSGADAVHMSIYANSEGRSHALPALAHDDDVFLEASFVYHRWPGGAVQATPYMIAHELLHLYGAWDLYENGSVTREQADAAADWFAYDVMRQNADLERLEIGPLTAWRIGWAPKAEPWYGWFRPLW